MFVISFSFLLSMALFLSTANFASVPEPSTSGEHDAKTIQTKQEVMHEDYNISSIIHEEVPKSALTDSIKANVLKHRIDFIIRHLNTTIEIAGHAAEALKNQLNYITSSFFNKTESDIEALKNSIVQAASEVKSAKGHIIGANNGILTCIIAELKNADQLIEDGKIEIYACVRSTLNEVLGTLANLDNLVIEANIAVNVAVGNLLTCASILDKEELCICLDTVLVELETASYVLISQVVSAVLNTGVLLARLPGQLLACAGSVIVALTFSIGKHISTLLSCVSLV